MLRFVAPLALIATLSGCALTTRHPSVAELKYNPGRYQDRTVAIDGVVTSSWAVPLMPFKLYKVDDGTGEMTVLAQGGRVPSEGLAGQRQGTGQRCRDVWRPVGRTPSRTDRDPFQGTVTDTRCPVRCGICMRRTSSREAASGRERAIRS